MPLRLRESAVVHINGVQHRVHMLPDAPLLWVLRDILGLDAPAIRCGLGRCGTCMVLLDGVPQPACKLTVEGAVGREVTTIEVEPEQIVAAAISFRTAATGRRAARIR